MKKVKGFDIFANVFLLIIVFFCLVPLALLVISSLTENDSLIRNGYSFFPEAMSLGAYKYLLNSGSQIMRAYGMSFIVTGIGTAFSIVLTTTLAYAISKKNLPGGKILTFIVSSLQCCLTVVLYLHI